MVWSESAGSKHTVNMGMMLQSLVPGMEYAEETDLCAQVPGIASSCTSGQLESCEAGRGLCGKAALLVGGTMLGGTALGGVSRCRRTPTTAKMTSPTTSAVAAAAINARMRRRRLRRDFTAMVSC